MSILPNHKHVKCSPVPQSVKCVIVISRQLTVHVNSFGTNLVSWYFRYPRNCSFWLKLSLLGIHSPLHYYMLKLLLNYWHNKYYCSKLTSNYFIDHIHILGPRTFYYILVSTQAIHNTSPIGIYIYIYIYIHTHTYSTLYVVLHFINIIQIVVCKVEHLL